MTPGFAEILEDRDAQGLVMPVMEFLNQGGARDAVLLLFKQYDRPIFEGDLTGDGIPELGIFDRFLNVLGCRNGAYDILFKPDPEWFYGHSEMPFTPDMNTNHIAELVVYNPNSCGFMWECSEAFIFEWDGQEFLNIVENAHSGTITMSGPFKISVTDVDGNGTQEFVATGGVPLGSAYADGLPWREQSDVYMWNGNAFVLEYATFEPAEYRFQAVQDGDRATLQGDFVRALESYEQAIQDDDLGWWTPERRIYEQAVNTLVVGATPPVLNPPEPDPAERAHLSAYAQFRMMLLHVLQGRMAEARLAHETLQSEFPEGDSGDVIAEMASVFWTEIQSTASIGEACSITRQFTAAHRIEILSYLGNTGDHDYHGWQSLRYQPRDVCPFDGW